MGRWIGIAFALLVVMIGLHTSAWANSELHPGGRLFFALWDVSTTNRLTFIIVTREAMREGANIEQVGNQWRVTGNPGKCLPRGNNGSTTNVNRTDLGGTASTPVFVDDVHFEYYGQSCLRVDEIVHMSCADIDLFVLANPNNETIKPRSVFSSVAGEGRGALDVHFTTNGQAAASNRKLENSLMGHAIITDLAEGWSANYAAAPAKAVSCFQCDEIDGGTPVGYENYAMELYLPFALADPFPTEGGDLRNILSLWGPTLLPAGNLNNTVIDITWKWWDGRERFRAGSIIDHSIILPLGGASIEGLDSPLDSAGFNVANFTCGHAGGGGTGIFPQVGKAENDGFPRTGTSATACGVPDDADPTHKSDNFQSSFDLDDAGHTIQASTPIGWWRFQLLRDGEPPPSLDDSNHDHSGRGLVGVVLSSTPGAESTGVGFATRLWHEDSCETAQSGETIGPPHKGHGNISSNDVALFNTFTLSRQRQACPPLRFLQIAPGLLDLFD